jgi:hypothetical protein
MGNNSAQKAIGKGDIKVRLSFCNLNEIEEG